jgi:dipeptidase D
MINLDSETEGVFTVGCAGGRDAVTRRDMQYMPLPDEDHLITLAVGGLRGGHSGIDIHRHRANACKLLARTLKAMLKATGLRLVEINGGTKRNAIPRDARALVACLPSRIPELRRQAGESEALFRSEYATEPSLFISLTEEPAGDRRKAAVSADALMLLNLILALPHGVAEMAPGFPDLVMSSSNLAIARSLRYAQSTPVWSAPSSGASTLE